jgi:hypothetical protein
LQSYPKEELKGHPVSFVNALEEYKARNRKLFGIREIDRLLSFSGKKNICIVDKSYSKSSFLYSIIAQFCIDYCRDTDRSEEEEEEDNKKENKTVLIDAGNGNNLGYIYISLVNKAFKAEADVRKILDRTIVTRAFTFQQLASIVLKGNSYPDTKNGLQYTDYHHGLAGHISSIIPFNVFIKPKQTKSNRRFFKVKYRF